MPSRTEKYDDFEAMLEEAQNYFNAQIRTFDVFRDHGKTVLGASSVVVSLFAVFGTSVVIGKNVFEYALIVIVIAIMYGWLMFNCLLASIPKTFNYPIKSSEQVYAKAFLNKSKKDIVKQRLANYLNVIEKNEVLIQERREKAILITAQLTLIVIFILAISLLQLFL